MDVDLARTFLAVVDTGSFVAAAARVHVTQSTVSMRVRTLENRLGKVLFERSKSGAALTPAGEQFMKHAQAMVRVWEHARLEIALPEGFDIALRLGGQFSLWDQYLLECVASIRSALPNIAVRAQMGFSDTLMQGLIDGVHDFCVLYTPQVRPGFEVEMLFEDELVLVTSDVSAVGHWKNNYVFIDWGPEFRADHSLNFPELNAPGTFLELGSLSVQYLLQQNASGYVPRRTIAPLVESNDLKLVPRAPVFSYPAYVAYPSDAESDLTGSVLDILHSVAEKQGG